MLNAHIKCHKYEAKMPEFDVWTLAKPHMVKKRELYFVNDVVGDKWLQININGDIG